MKHAKLTELTTEELETMLDAAFSEYYKLATVPCGAPPPKAEMIKLERAINKYEALREEFEKRINNKLS